MNNGDGHGIVVDDLRTGILCALRSVSVRRYLVVLSTILLCYPAASSFQERSFRRQQRR